MEVGIIPSPALVPANTPPSVSVSTPAFTLGVSVPPPPAKSLSFHSFFRSPPPLLFLLTEPLFFDFLSRLSLGFEYGLVMIVRGFNYGVQELFVRSWCVRVTGAMKLVREHIRQGKSKEGSNK